MQYPLPIVEENNKKAELPYFTVDMNVLCATSAIVSITDNNGHSLDYTLPGNASLDSRLISLWLHDKSPETIRAYILDISKFYDHLLERYTKTLKEQGVQVLCIQQCRVDEVQSFKNSLTSFASSTQARSVAALKSLLTYGADTRILPFNVGRVVKLARIEDTLAERITSEQNIMALLIEAKKGGRRNYAIITLLYNGGLRDAELCDLKWRNIQTRENAGQVSIYGKGKKTRTVLLKKETWDIVMSLKKETDTPDDYVFKSQKEHTVQVNDETRQSRRLDESAVLRIVKKIAVKANVEVFTLPSGKKSSRLSPHWLRHAHATHARKHGAPLTLVQRTLGHASINTTAKYDHVTPDESSATYLEI